MNFQLTEQIIKLLCGQISYKKGESYYRAGKVTFTSYNPEASFYKATVQESSPYHVTVSIDGSGNVDAACSCPALASYDKYCKHVAAVLLNLCTIQRNGNAPITASATGTLAISSRDLRLTHNILGLFGDKPLRSSRAGSHFDTRAPLLVEFTLRPVTYGYRKHMFGIEMKVGPKRLYVVQNIREFLERIERREASVFSKLFTYDPELFSFQPEDDAVIQQLIQIYRNEETYRQTANVHTYQINYTSGERMLLIPPYLWEAFLPLLTKVPSAQLELHGRSFDGIQVSNEPVPLHFEMDQALAEGYQMDVRGLDEIIVMESYGVVLFEGKLLALQSEPCKRLAELKQMLDSSNKHRIQISSEQMGPFMEKVIPGLMKLGSVRIAEAISDRIIQTQLKAKLYLDRVRDRLLAGLEFQYGNIVINPLEVNAQKTGEDRILLRDGDQERRILELMEQSAFSRTESGYFMDDEDGEYEFLYHIVPQLEKLVQIYATSAVKARLFTEHAPPKITVDVDERTNWLEFQFDIAGIPESEIRNLLESLEDKRRYYRMPNGALLPLESAEFQEIVRLMNEVGIRKGDMMGTKFRLPVVRGLHLMDFHRQGNAVKLTKSFRLLLENLQNPDNLDFPAPDSLAPVLRDYQKFGYGWLKTLAHYHFGGILADDMGLGKTLQSIAFIVSVLPEIREQRQPAMIVSPASLVYNWRNELKKFAPEIRAVIADGTKAERSRMLKNISEVDVIITSYPLLRRDIDLYAGLSFHTLIMDEAQFFKNHTTQTAQVVKLIQAEYRFALTGTPVENTLEELWSIFGAVFPALFPDRKEFNELSRETVARRVRPFLLRRLKTDVLKELPEKIESLQATELLPDQKKLYMAYLAKLKQETLKHLNDKTFHKNKIKILAGLTRLRQLCCHPALFVEDYKGSAAKFEQLMDIVEECQSAGKRVLVFSQFTTMLGLIGRELDQHSVSYFYLDGQTPALERVELCSRFNEGERDLFLISLKAGGTGLNLTGADTVILYDLWWNPAVEEQAADRAHRIGQKNVVQVIRLVTQGTVEDKMYELQQKKKNLIDEVIQPGHEALSSLTEQEIREILMI